MLFSILRTNTQHMCSIFRDCRVVWLFVLLAFTLTYSDQAAADRTISEVSTAADTPGLAVDRTPLRTLDLSFRDLGQFDVATLRGIDGSHYLPFGVRLDEAVTRARLTLRYAYSPAMLEDLSHLRISLNGETLNVVPLPRDRAGTYSGRRHSRRLRVDAVPSYVLLA